MTLDPTHVAEPLFVLASWAAGVAVVSGWVVSLRIVGAGFTRLAIGVSLLVGVAGAFSRSAAWSLAAVTLLVVGLFAARWLSVGWLMWVAGLGFGVHASVIGGVAPAVTAAGALGGVTTVMLLGHWYLIDPRLPRWALRALALIAIGGLGADAVLLGGAGIPSGTGQVAFWVLAVTSILLMAAVIATLRYPAYSGVMAATGLSYLAVLTSLGAVFLGRALLSGLEIP